MYNLKQGQQSEKRKWKKERKKLENNYDYYLEQCKKAENCHKWALKKLVYRRKFFS